MAPREGLEAEEHRPGVPGQGAPPLRADRPTAPRAVVEGRGPRYRRAARQRVRRAGRIPYSSEEPRPKRWARRPALHAHRMDPGHHPDAFWRDRPPLRRLRRGVLEPRTQLDARQLLERISLLAAAIRRQYRQRAAGPA